MAAPPSRMRVGRWRARWLTAFHGWRPSLLVWVVVAALGVVSALALVTANLAADRMRDLALSEALRNAKSMVASYLDPELSPDTLRPGGPRNSLINDQLERLVASHHLLRVVLWSPAGEVVYASDAMLRGHTEAVDEDLRKTLEGASTVEYGDVALASADMEKLPVLPAPFLELYIPIQGPSSGAAIGVYEMYEDASPIEARVADLRTWVMVTAFAAEAALFAILWLAFARTSRLLRERVIRDPLTGLHNHRHLLDHLAADLAAVQGGRLPGGSVALLDVDSFRLLNAGHGHRAGDATLRLVADVLQAAVPSAMSVGRFGPDEFLIIDLGPEGDPSGDRLLTVIETIRAALREVDLVFGASERLPVTASVGIARVPQDGTDVLELLSVAEAALREAKTGGGSVTRVADLATIGSLTAQNSVFGVFEGLVATVDAKDHYTRYHSEHVTSLALELADALGLSDDDRRRLRLAGLLHDVGKVGIPDAILRKPGPLTVAEYEVVKQHVALGDLMVGAVPQLAEVRAAIRHHHERWDGSGYLDGLRADGIPLLARILSVADAYSALTTDRPYRKALGAKEALARVAQAAGSQLDPNLAMVFVSAMRRRLAAEARAERGRAGRRVLRPRTNARS